MKIQTCDNSKGRYYLFKLNMSYHDKLVPARLKRFLKKLKTYWNACLRRYIIINVLQESSYKMFWKITKKTLENFHEISAVECFKSTPVY